MKFEGEHNKKSPSFPRTAHRDHSKAGHERLLIVVGRFVSTGTEIEKERLRDSIFFFNTNFVDFRKDDLRIYFCLTWFSIIFVIKVVLDRFRQKVMCNSILKTFLLFNLALINNKRGLYKD